MKSKIKIVLISAAMFIIVWLVSAVFDAFLFNKGKFSDYLILDVPFNEALFRIVISFIAVFHIFAMYFVSGRIKKAETKSYAYKNINREFENELIYQVGFEKLIADLAVRFINIPYEKLDDEINNALESLGRFVGVDRSYVFLVDEDRQTMSNTNEWCAEGISQEINNLQKIPIDTCPWWIKNLTEAGVVYVPDVELMPKEAKNEKKILEAQSIKSVIVVPMIYDNVLKGFMGFDSVKSYKIWVNEHIGLLKIGATIIINAIERSNIQKSLIYERDRFAQFIDIVGVIIVVLDTNIDTVLINRKGAEILGFSEEEIIGKNWVDNYLPIRLRKKVKTDLLKMVSGEWDYSVSYENEILTKEGTERTIIWHASLLKDRDGEIIGVIGSGEDITDYRLAEREREKMQNQFFQVQKMESIGHLAGGIAHDFNNLLTVINGYTELLLSDPSLSEFNRENISEICEAAQKAASLTSQLLAFSRKQLLQIKTIDINELIRVLSKMLYRMIGEDIRLTLNLAPVLYKIKADAGQIEQVIMNLAINARDAMPDGGKLTISTSNCVIDEFYVEMNPYASTGDFVCLTISDNGVGIERNTIQNIFDPFFTTKDVGKGTGLGLSVVYGVVKQHSGWIDVDSQVNKGTIFKIYFPAIDTPVSTEKKSKPRFILSEFVGHGQRILLIEDEERLLALTSRVLSENGYEVFTAFNASEGIKIFREENGNFDLVFSDVVLPDKSGYEMVMEMQEFKEDLNILFCSGYADNKSKWNLISQKGYQFIQKPFSLNDLLRKIHFLLE